MPTTVKESDDFELPVGALMTIIGRQYAGALSHALEDCGADRYLSLMLFLHHAKRPVKQQFLADSLRIDKASIVRMLDYLVERNLIERVVNPSNRREYLLELTASGKRKIPRIEKEIAQTDNLLFEGISPVAREKFLKTLKKLAGNAVSIPARPVTLHFKHNSKSSC